MGLSSGAELARPAVELSGDDEGGGANDGWSFLFVYLNVFLKSAKALVSPSSLSAASSMGRGALSLFFYEGLDCLKLTRACVCSDLLLRH